MDKSILHDILDKYKRHFPVYSQNELFKWEAVKWFQDNWDIDAVDFAEMFKRATDPKKTASLLASVNRYPSGMIQDFAKVDAEAVRTMFVNLFDESLDLKQRIQDFKDSSEELRVKYNPTQWKLHYQDENSITTYLWLRYPDKYYLYKYKEVRNFAKVVGSGFIPKKGDGADNVIGTYALYDEIRSEVHKDHELIDMVNNALNSECYSDKNCVTLTMDIGFYVSRYYIDELGSNEPENTIKEIAYWPSEDEYPVNISKDEWKRFILESEYEHHMGCMRMLRGLMELGGEATCKKLSSVYGGHPTRYVGCAVNIGNRAKKYFGLDSCIDNGHEYLFTIPFVGRRITEEGTEYYSYKIRDELMSALSDIDLTKFDPFYKQDESMSPNYWWLVASPKVWSFSDMAVGETQDYTMYNERGNKRVVFQNFLDVAEGDLVIGYEATPVKKIVALARISLASDGERIHFEKLESLENPISFEELKSCDELSEMEFFRQMNGSLFKLSAEEYDFIMELIRAENPEQKKESNPKYDKEAFINDVYISESKYDELSALLLHKQNVILQGAPGVGKTYAAKRLAYSIMGEIDEKRVGFVQFHQNYSYEDFVMGYRPNDEGGFSLRKGTFLKFCQNAADYPDKKFFFIIDEINRGNMSKIFGELLMLIEKDYRGESVTLAYNNEKFCVPKNVYIIGMMNTADRSLAIIDYALRRRFSFFDMKPGFDSEGFQKYQAFMDNQMFNKLIDKIVLLNATISDDDSLGEGFCIGHSYFCGMVNSKECTREHMSSIINYDILPMLREYWFDDKEKVNQWSAILKGVLDD